VDESAIGAFDASGDVVVVRCNGDIVFDGAIGERSFPPREWVLDLSGTVIEICDGGAAGDECAMPVGFFVESEFDDTG